MRRFNLHHIVWWPIHLQGSNRWGRAVLSLWRATPLLPAEWSPQLPTATLHCHLCSCTISGQLPRNVGPDRSQQQCQVWSIQGSSLPSSTTTPVNTSLWSPLAPSHSSLTWSISLWLGTLQWLGQDWYLWALHNSIHGLHKVTTLVKSVQGCYVESEWEQSWVWLNIGSQIYYLWMTALSGRSYLRGNVWADGWQFNCSQLVMTIPSSRFACCVFHICHFKQIQK